MRGYHAIVSMLRVDRSDDCIWLVDDAQSVHMTPDQAVAAGKALLEAGESSSNSLSLPITACFADIIDKQAKEVEPRVGEVELKPNIKAEFDPKDTQYTLLLTKDVSGSDLASVLGGKARPWRITTFEFGKPTGHETFETYGEAKASIDREVLVETLAAQSKLSGYTNGLTEAHRLLAVA